MISEEVELYWRGIDDMKKQKEILTQLLAPFTETLDDDFRSTFRQFAKCVAPLGMHCTNEQAMLLELSKKLQQSIDVETSLVEAKSDVEKVRRKVEEIYDEKSKLDQLFEEGTQRADIVLDDLRQKFVDNEFHAKKSKIYQSTIENIKRNLTNKQGFTEELLLDNVEGKRRNLAELEAQLGSISKRLTSFRSLPPDVHLAKVKLEEKRVELADLEKSLNELIDSYQARTD